MSCTSLVQQATMKTTMTKTKTKSMSKTMPMAQSSAVETVSNWTVSDSQWSVSDWTVSNSQWGVSDLTVSQWGVDQRCGFVDCGMDGLTNWSQELFLFTRKMNLN